MTLLYRRRGPYTFGPQTIWKESNGRQVVVAHFGLQPRGMRAQHVPDGVIEGYELGVTTDKSSGVVFLALEDLTDSRRLVKAFAEQMVVAVVAARQGENLREAIGHLIHDADAIPLTRTSCMTGWLVQPDGSGVYVHVGEGGQRIYDGDREGHLAALDAAGPVDHAIVHRFLAGPAGIKRARLATLTPLVLAAPILMRHIAGGRSIIMHFEGPSGTGKTAYFQLLTRAIVDPRAPETERMGSWSSTINSLERMLSVAGDQPVFFDDLKWQVVSGKDALRLVQTTADGRCKGRLQSDASAGRQWPPRGTLISAGEDAIAESASAVARVLRIPVEPGDLDGPSLAYDRDWPARAVMAAYVASLSGSFTRWVGWSIARVQVHAWALRQMFPNAPHGRLYEVGALLIAAAEPFAHFAETVGAASGSELVSSWHAVLCELLISGASQVEEAQLGARFVESLHAFIDAGQIRVDDFSDRNAGESIGFRTHKECIAINPPVAVNALKRLDPEGWRSVPMNVVGSALVAEGFVDDHDPGKATRKLSRGRSNRARYWLVRLDRFAPAE